MYSKIPLLRPPFGLPKSGLIDEVALTLLHSEWPKLCGVLAILSGKGLILNIKS